MKLVAAETTSIQELCNSLPQIKLITCNCQRLRRTVRQIAIAHRSSVQVYNIGELKEIIQFNRKVS